MDKGLETKMDKGFEGNELMSLATTYSILTADRILERFGIRLDQDTLIRVVGDSNSLYFAVLLVPYTNVINGIILQQAYDYQVYAQKLFIDYLVSGNGNDNPEAQGAGTRAALEEERVKLVHLGELFDNETVSHKQLILETQAHLSQLVRKLAPIKDTEEITQLVQQGMLPYHQRAVEKSEQLNKFRADFKNIILETLKFIQLLPDYKPNEELDEKNKVALQFDDDIGVYE